MKKLVVICSLFCSCTSASAAQPPEFGDLFWQHWGDGRAEIAGYDLTYQRYGEPRQGTAIAIFVTETFSDTARVKANPGLHPKRDEYPVLKLNLVQDFQTGVYDYNMMSSSFAQLTARSGHPPGSLTKVSFSAQEWCGHAYTQLLFDRDRIRHTSHSYFDGEADEVTTMDYPKNGLSAESLFFWARGLAGPQLGPGKTTTVPFLPSLERTRLDHRPLTWSSITLEREAKPETLSVPGGEFEVETFTARAADGLVYTFRVERAFPNRLIAWHTNRGDKAQLRGVQRLKYWELNREGNESILEKIGLSKP